MLFCQYGSILVISPDHPETNYVLSNVQHSSVIFLTYMTEVRRVAWVAESALILGV